MTNPTYNSNPLTLKDICLKHSWFSMALDSLETLVEHTNYGADSFIIVEQRTYRKHRFIIVRANALDSSGYSYRHSGFYNTWTLEEANQEGAFLWE